MYFLSNFLECNISLLPVRHLEGIEEAEDLSNLLVILFNIVSSNLKILSNLIEHLSSNIIELHWLGNDQPDIW